MIMNWFTGEGLCMGMQMGCPGNPFTRNDPNLGRVIEWLEQSLMNPRPMSLDSMDLE